MVWESLQPSSDIPHFQLLEHSPNNWDVTDSAALQMAQHARTEGCFLGDGMQKTLAGLMSRHKQRGGIGYVLLWLVGVPIPVLILISLLRGCA